MSLNKLTKNMLPEITRSILGMVISKMSVFVFRIFTN